MILYLRMSAFDLGERLNSFWLLYSKDYGTRIYTGI
jgi:hypothetical protein